MTIMQFATMVVVVVALSCALVTARAVELREGYKLESTLNQNELLRFDLQKARLELSRIKAPTSLENRAIAMGIVLKPAWEKGTAAADVRVAKARGRAAVIAQAGGRNP